MNHYQKTIIFGQMRSNVLNDCKLSYFHGFSLIEILIATFVLTIGLLGITAIYINSFQKAKSSYWRTLAGSQLISIMEVMPILGNEFSSLQQDVERNLPHGEIILKGNTAKVCWRERKEQYCITNER